MEDRKRALLPAAIDAQLNDRGPLPAGRILPTGPPGRGEPEDRAQAWLPVRTGRMGQIYGIGVGRFTVQIKMPGDLI